MCILTTGPAVENHVSPKMARVLIPTSSSSSSQDSAFDVSRYTSKSSTRKKWKYISEELRGNPLHKPTETENTNQNEDDEELRSELLRDLPEWLQEFRENMVDESVPTESQ